MYAYTYIYMVRIKTVTKITLNGNREAKNQYVKPIDDFSSHQLLPNEKSVLLKGLGIQTPSIITRTLNEAEN